MKKLLFTLLVVVIGLAPSLASAQATPGEAGSSDKSGASGAPSPSGGSTTAPSAAPSASPATGGSGSSADLSQYKTEADCEKNGGQWQTSTSTCAAKASK
jgi:hypothetical protein